MQVFIKKAAQYGAKVVSDKGKHLKFRDSLGHQISAPKTTSDWRAIKNFESELRGRGFVNQQATKKVKDALVKGTKTTALPASRKTANQQTTFKQFTQRFQPNVQGPKKPNSPVVQKQGRVQGPESELAHRHKKAFDNRLDELIKSVRGRTVAKSERKKITRAQLDAMKISQKEKDKLVKQGLVGEQLAQEGVHPLEVIHTEQMVVPRSIKKKNPLMTPETEMELLKRLSNRKAVYDAARTGKAMYPFSEGVRPREVLHTEDNKHREDKLNYQYKQVTNPKRPEDPIKKIKKGLV